MVNSAEIQQKCDGILSGKALPGAAENAVLKSDWDPLGRRAAFVCATSRSLSFDCTVTQKFRLLSVIEPSAALEIIVNSL